MCQRQSPHAPQALCCLRGWTRSSVNWGFAAQPACEGSAHLKFSVSLLGQVCTNGCLPRSQLLPGPLSNCSTPALLQSAQSNWSLSSAGLLRPSFMQVLRASEHVLACATLGGESLMRDVEQSCCWPSSTSCCWTHPASFSCLNSRNNTARARHTWHPGTQKCDSREQEDDLGDAGLLL